MGQNVERVGERGDEKRRSRVEGARLGSKRSAVGGEQRRENEKRSRTVEKEESAMEKGKAFKSLIAPTIFELAEGA